MKITISGTIGSGKSTVAKLLASKLKYKYYYTGQIMRKLAEKRNMTLNDLGKIAIKDTSIDSALDAYQTKIGKTKNNFVLDGHLGFHFVPDSLKIFLECDEYTASKRILKSLKKGDSFRVKEGLKKNKDAIFKEIKNRRKIENKRYTKIYHIKQDDKNNFDLVIDTSNISAEKACDKILKFIKIKEKEAKKTAIKTRE